MIRIYTSIVFLAVVSIFSLDASAQATPNGAPNGSVPTNNNSRANGAPNGTVKNGASKSLISVAVAPTIDTPSRVRKQPVRNNSGVVSGSTADADRFDRGNIGYIYAPATDQSQNIQVQSESNGRSSYNSPAGTKETSYNMCTIFRTLNRCK